MTLEAIKNRILVNLNQRIFVVVIVFFICIYYPELKKFPLKSLIIGNGRI